MIWLNVNRTKELKTFQIVYKLNRNDLVRKYLLFEIYSI